MEEDFNLTDWLSPTDDLEPTVAKPSLTSNEVKILTYCEQVYWETGSLPTPEKIKEELNLSSRNAFSNETFRTQLAQRGIDPVGLVEVGKVIAQTKTLSATQILCANMMLNLHDKRTEREKLQILGVSSQQYHAWLRQPQFVEFMRKRGEALFSSADHLAYKSLVQNVQARDNKSLELFFRMRGIYNPTISVNFNIEAILIRVVEVISTHVKDPHVINAIATELENIIEIESEAS